MTGQQAKDGLPDVVIRSTVNLPGTDLEGRRGILVTHEVACRWCPESLSTPDVRTAVRWADKHEDSALHNHSKEDRIFLDAGPRDPWS